MPKKTVRGRITIIHFRYLIVNNLNVHLKAIGIEAVKLETFTNLKALVKNPYYREQKQKSLFELRDAEVDGPMVGLINGFNNVPCCFTLQSCYGHFVYNGQKDPHNVDPLPESHTIDRVTYRIAYIAFCIENGLLGKKLVQALRKIVDIDPKNVHFGCAKWFWKRQVNSYVLQVEPDRFKYKDTAMLDYKEALHIEKTRNALFARLSELQNI